MGSSHVNTFQYVLCRCHIYFAASVVEVPLEHTCFEVLKNTEALVWRLVLPNMHGVRTIDHRAIPAGHEAGAGAAQGTFIMSTTRKWSGQSNFVVLVRIDMS